VAAGRGDSSEVTLTVKKEGGASSSASTTYINDTEWSSTGLSQPRPMTPPFFTSTRSPSTSTPPHSFPAPLSLL